MQISLISLLTDIADKLNLTPNSANSRSYRLWVYKCLMELLELKDNASERLAEIELFTYHT